MLFNQRLNSLILEILSLSLERVMKKYNLPISEKDLDQTKDILNLLCKSKLKYFKTFKKYFDKKRSQSLTSFFFLFFFNFISRLISCFHQWKHNYISQVVLLSQNRQDSLKSHSKSRLWRHSILHCFNESFISTRSFIISLCCGLSLLIKVCLLEQWIYQF